MSLSLYESQSLSKQSPMSVIKLPQVKTISLNHKQRGFHIINSLKKSSLKKEIEHFRNYLSLYVSKQHGAPLTLQFGGRGGGGEKDISFLKNVFGIVSMIILLKSLWS